MSPVPSLERWFAIVAETVFGRVYIRRTKSHAKPVFAGAPGEKTGGLCNGAGPLFGLS